MSAALRIDPDDLRRVTAEAEAAYPEEACGLLVGRVDGEVAVVAEVHRSRNVAACPRRAFEIDPVLLLALHKRLRDADEAMIGVYHSHPDGAAVPSATDLDRAWEPNLIWLIVSVLDGRAVATAAHRLVAGGGRFAPLPLVSDAAMPDGRRRA